MIELIGKIKAELVEKDSSIPEGLIEKINSNVQPPEPVNSDNVYIRAMYIVSDQINSYGGRFPADEHQKLADLLIDSPVLIGHRKDTLPIARNFHAEPVMRDNTNWVKVYFYWLKNSEAGEELKNNIDAGIYKECSISFIFSFPECSICGSDIRECRHQPFHEYETQCGEKTEAHFNYRRIEKVLETSLVYRGSVSDTSITKELAFQKDEPEFARSTIKPVSVPIINRIWKLESLDQQAEYLVMPAYEGLRILLRKTGGAIQLQKADGTPIKFPRFDRNLKAFRFPGVDFTCDCRLVGYRGKERQKAGELVKFIRGETSSVSRTELKIYDLVDLDDADVSKLNAIERREKLEELFGAVKGILPPSELVSGDNSHNALKNIGTRHGIEISSVHSAEKYLFTRQKLVRAIVLREEEAAQRNKYHFELLVDDKSVPVDSPVISTLRLSVGEIIDLRVASVNMVGDSVQLIDPVVLDRYGELGSLDSISLSSGCLGRRLRGTYSLFPINPRESALILNHGNGGEMERYIIHRFSPRLIDNGRVFLIEKSEKPELLSDRNQRENRIVDCTVSDSSITLTLAGLIRGRFAIRPAKLNDRVVTVLQKIEDISR